MFSTPSKPLYLPSYARGLAHIFAEVPSPVPICTRCYNARVLDFVDVEARHGAKSDGSSSCSV